MIWSSIPRRTIRPALRRGAAAQKKMSAEKGYYLKGIEGLRGGYWALVDMRDILVNVFLPKKRAKYDLDKLWKDLPQIDPETCL